MDHLVLYCCALIFQSAMAVHRKKVRICSAEQKLYQPAWQHESCLQYAQNKRIIKMNFWQKQKRSSIMLTALSSAHFCAFCKHWFDPCCTSITPKDSFGNIWEIRKNEQKPCILHHLPKQAAQTCADFEMKL